MGKLTQICLILFSAFCLFCGIFLAFWPFLERETNLEKQRNLLVSITEGDGEIVLPNDASISFIQTDEMDYYCDENAVESEDFLTTFDENEIISEDNIKIIGTGILKIQKIGLALPVIEGVRSSDLKVGVGHVPETPAIGEKGNAVIAGHRSYTYGVLFNRLDEVEIGDIIEYHGIGMNLLSFKVYEILTVEPGDSAVFDPTAFPSITLLTCTPVRVATHRLIVRGRMISE